MKEMNRRTFLSHSAGTTAAAALSPTGFGRTRADAGGAVERPNIVLIMADQHNAGLMGCAGDKYVKTPHLDSLADEGVLFTNAYCPYPLCAPSRMSFLTAQYASDIGMWHNSSRLPSTVPTFAHSLGAGGYEAVLCGRMHFASPDQFHGFEKRIYGDVYSTLTTEILGPGSDKTTGQSKIAVEISGYGRTGYDEYDNVVTEKACDYIAAHRDSERPYCLVVGLVRPHNPLICSKEWFDYYFDKIPVPEPLSERYRKTLHPAIKKWRERRGVENLTMEQHHRALVAYYGLVSEHDARIGKMINTVKSSPEAKNTIIIYTSDHGDSACEQHMWWKLNFYNGSVRVPLLVSQPSVFEGGVKLKTNVNLIDVGPTLLDVSGCEPLPDVSGKSLLGLLDGSMDESEWPDEVFSECLGQYGDQPACMMRTGPWKLIYYHEFKSYQLFNLEEDPAELHDRSNDSACRDIVESCLEKIHSRWSAEKMLEGYAREQRALQLVRKCGHPLIPNQKIIHGIPDVKGSNEFDFAQLKNN